MEDDFLEYIQGYYNKLRDELNINDQDIKASSENFTNVITC